jgi:uncharacterized coiled-coil DUF342 family protein
MTSEGQSKQAGGEAKPKARKEATSQKLEELRAKVRQLKGGRDALNAKLRSKRDSVMGFYGEIDKLLKEAKTHKDSRDSANKNVSENKKKRDDANAKIAELNKKLSGLKKRTGGGMSRRDYEKLKEEYEKLNWKMQTTPLSKEKETQMVRRLEELEGSVKEYEASRPAEKEIIEIEKELRKIRTAADSHHNRLLKDSEDGEKAHAGMHEIYKTVDAKRERAKKAEDEFLAVKKEVDEAHNKFVEVLNELRAEEEKLGIARAKERGAGVEKFKKKQQDKEVDLLAELRKGGVIKTEDLLFLQSTAEE